MVCDKVVSKMVCDKDGVGQSCVSEMEAEAVEEKEEAEAGYRIKKI